MNARSHRATGTVRYFSRLGVQAISDANRRFVYMSARSAGLTYDTTAFGSLILQVSLDNDRPKSVYWLAGDEEYLCSEWLLTF